MGPGRKGRKNGAKGEKTSSGGGYPYIWNSFTRIVPQAPLRKGERIGTFHKPEPRCRGEKHARLYYREEKRKPQR